MGVRSVALVVGLVALGCNAAPPGHSLRALPPCEPPPSAEAHPPVRGLVLPQGAVLLQVSERPPMTHVAGYVPSTPVDVRLAYESDDRVDVVTSEDEVFEAELLLVADGRRSFVRATAACDRGSHLLVIVAPDTDAKGLPAPRAGATPGRATPGGATGG